MRSKRYDLGGEYNPYDGNPKKKGTSVQERKDYAAMKATREMERLRRRAGRKGERSERRGDDPIGYRETIHGGNPRFMLPSVRQQAPIYQDEYDMLQRAAEVNPLDFYEQVGHSGVRKGGEFADPCREGNKGAGAAVACDAKKARQVASQRQGKKTTFMDVLMSRLRGRMINGNNREAQKRYTPYNDQEQAMIDRERGMPTRGIKLNNTPPSGFSINFQ